jgi:flagellar hook assembly protein FlgD
VDLGIYDVTGRLVRTLVSERMEAGYHTITWQPKSLASGIYFAKLKVTLAEQALLLQSVIDSGMESYTDTKKLILLR